MPSIKRKISNRVRIPVKKIKRKISWQYRLVTWRGRALPDFIIIGAMKSGTTSLFYYLSQHPQLYPSFSKEIHFFDNSDRFAKGEAFYRAYFPLNDEMSIDTRTYEASPRYIFDPHAPKRIFDIVPKVKLIAVLRNPTERAISHYFHNERRNREPLSIDKAMLEEEGRLEQAINAHEYNSKAFIHYSYKRRGLYKEQIERYLNYFSLQQILVFSSEELFSQPDICLRRIFDFVGVESEFKVKKLAPVHVGSNRSKVDPAIYEYLNDYFEPHNQALYELLGNNFGW